MKPPKTVQVGSITYSVSVQGSALDTEAVRIGARRGLYGLTDLSAGKITLAKDNSLGRQQEVLLHELLHTMTEFAGLGDDLGLEKDEAVCNRLAPILLHVLRQNPELVDYLLEGA